MAAGGVRRVMVIALQYPRYSFRPIAIIASAGVFVAYRRVHMIRHDEDGESLVLDYGYPDTRVLRAGERHELPLSAILGAIGVWGLGLLDGFTIADAQETCHEDH